MAWLEPLAIEPPMLTQTSQLLDLWGQLEDVAPVWSLTAVG
jgi:hypothetical protein